MTPHVHKDLIIAWANGAQIQCYSGIKETWLNLTNPTWHEDAVYRIKPVIKKCRVALFKSVNDSGTPKWAFAVQEAFFNVMETNPHFIKWISPVIEYTED